MVSQDKPIQKKEIIEKLVKHISEIEKFGVEKIGIFGSLLKGETTGDVEILISFIKNEVCPTALLPQNWPLEDTLNAQIDLVTTNALSPYIGPYILREVEYIEA